MADFSVISPSPHIHSGNRTDRLMYTVVIALIPALLTGVYFFGVRALLLTITSIISCLVFEYLIQRFILKQPNSITDGSAVVTGLLLSFNLPSSLPLWIVVIGALVAIGIGKMSFGGLGKNIFNPAIVGRVFLLISFPAQMTTWPLPENHLLDLDSTSGATILTAIKSSPNIHLDMLPLLVGERAGSIGETGAIALFIGLIILLIRKVITWHIPVSIVVSAFVTAAIFHWLDPEHYIPPHFQILAGGLLLGAFFMATDYVTSPMTSKGMLIYGCGIGIITILIRSFGSYPEGVSFAILIMNAFTPLINTYIHPKRFGGGQKR